MSCNRLGTNYRFNFIFIGVVVIFGGSTIASAADLITTFLSGGTHSLTVPALSAASPFDTLDGRGGVSFGGHYSDWYRSGGMENSGASFTRSFGVTGWQSFMKPVPWCLRIRQYSSFTHLNRKFSTELIDIRDNPSTFGFDILVNPYRAVWLQTGITGVQNMPTDLIFAGGVTFPRYFSTALQWTREINSFRMNAIWSGNPAEIRWRNRSEGMAGSFATGQFNGFRLIAEGSQRNWIRDTSFYSVPTFSPWGQSVGYRSALEYVHSPYIAALGLRGYRYDCMAYGMQNGITFAKITDLHLRQDGCFGSVQWRNQRRNVLQCELEYQHWSGYSRGHVEFWPFTPGWQSLLGQRRYYIANAAGNFWRIRLASDSMSVYRTTECGLTLDYLDCTVDGSFDHWKPAFLIFGKADEQLYALDIQRVTGTQIGFRISQLISRFRLQYQLQQFIPITIQKRTIFPTPPPTSSGKSSPVYGGGFHTISLATYW